MIIRIVKMTFREDEIQEFESIFNQNKEKIRNFSGVQKLELYRDKKHSNIYFTYSIWRNSEELENYRRSSLFKSVWTKTRALFKEKAEAWSVDQLVSI